MKEGLTERVVRAADRVGRARVTTNADDGNGSAGKTNHGGHILDNNAEKTEDLSRGWVTGISDGVTTLDYNSNVSRIDHSTRKHLPE